MDLKGVISLQPGTWSVQIAIPQDWPQTLHRFTFPNDDGALVEISGEVIEVVTDDSPELEVTERSFLVRWTNQHTEPIRVDYTVSPRGAGGLGGI